MSRSLDDFSSLSSDVCGECHVEIFREWSGSLHHKAWSDPIFQKAYNIESKAFCRGCHAPEANPSKSPTTFAQNEGVGCLTCHVVPSQGANSGSGASVIAAVHQSPLSPHNVRVETWLTTAAACEGCHQFNFPPDAKQLVASPMQNTHREWRSSNYSSSSCQQCHMPSKASGSASLGLQHTDHSFRVMGDANMLKKAVSSDAKRVSDTKVEIKLSSAWVGHAVPTGDMFRRLQVRAFAVDPETHRASGVVTTELARTFRDVPVDADSDEDMSTQRVEGKDTRLSAPGTPGDSRTVTLDIRAASSKHEVVWEVAYQRMMTPLATSFGVNQLEDEIVLYRGVLAPLPINHAK